MPSPAEDIENSNWLASDWMHRGIDLALQNSPAALERAIRCFDEAIALRRTFPLAENPNFAYGLSAGWINRGDALARLGGDHFLAEALKSYDEALTLLETLPLAENPLYPRRLAIAWINCGTALQSREASGRAEDAVACFQKAVDVLQHPAAAAIADRSALLAGAWVNLASRLINSDEEIVEARSALHRALALVQPAETQEVISSEVGLNARRLLCRLAVKGILDQKIASQEEIAEATQAADEGLALIRYWRSRGPNEFMNLSRDIFRFGCRIYATHEPAYLAEFLIESLAGEIGETTYLLDQETFAAAQAAIWSALEKLQPKDGFQFVATPHLQTYLREIQELRKVEERLEQLRAPGRAASIQAAVSAVGK